MEIIDILTEEGKQTGKTSSRFQIHSQGFWHAAIAIFVINQNNHTYFNNEIRTIYSLHMQNPKIIHCPKEISETKWVTLTELKNLYMNHTHDIVPHPEAYPLFFRHFKNGKT